MTDELRTLAEAASPGPWRADTETRGDCVLWGPAGQFICNMQATPHWLPDANGDKRAVMFDVDARDAALIEYLRNNVDKILAVLDAAKAAALEIVELHPNIRDANQQWFNDSTLPLVLAVDALDNPYPPNDPRGWVEFRDCRSDLCAAQRQHTDKCLGGRGLLPVEEFSRYGTWGVNDAGWSFRSGSTDSGTFTDPVVGVLHINRLGERTKLCGETGGLGAYPNLATCQDCKALYAQGVPS